MPPPPVDPKAAPGAGAGSNPFKEADLLNGGAKKWTTSPQREPISAYHPVGTRAFSGARVFPTVISDARRDYEGPAKPEKTEDNKPEQNQLTDIVLKDEDLKRLGSEKMIYLRFRLFCVVKRIKRVLKELRS